MKEFQCHKRVLAQPMTRGDYNKLRGWEVPSDENPLDEGYLVEYLDSPNGNHSDFAGYISWSPKSVFDAGYTEVRKTAEDVYIEQEKEKAVAIMQEYFPNGGRDYDAVCTLFDAIAGGRIPVLGLVYP